MKTLLIISLILLSTLTFAKDYKDGILIYNNLDTSLYLVEPTVKDPTSVLFELTMIDPLKKMLPETKEGKTKLPARAQVYISNPVSDCGEGKLTFVDDNGNKVNFFLKKDECKFFHSQSGKVEKKAIASTILASADNNQLQFFIFYHSGVEPLED